jgi:hypothetical protein
VKIKSVSRVNNNDATMVELLRQAIHWEATRAWWLARNGDYEASADAEERANFYTKQYNELPERAHRYVYR